MSGATAPVRAVLLDAFGTLIAMEPPAPRLRAELARRAGVGVRPAAAEAAFAAEIDFYVAHHLDGRDEHSLAALRDRCAAVIAHTLGIDGLDLGTVRAAMLASLRFVAQPDAEEALRALRAHGVRLVVASNWDSSLPHVLDEARLGQMLDAVVSSASVGAAKPDARLFEAALAVVGASPGEALHVGDSPEHDVGGAVAVGVRPVLIDRRGEAEHTSFPVIRTLSELPTLVSKAS